MSACGQNPHVHPHSETSTIDNDKAWPSWRTTWVFRLPHSRNQSTEQQYRSSSLMATKPGDGSGRGKVEWAGIHDLLFNTQWGKCLDDTHSSRHLRGFFLTMLVPLLRVSRNHMQRKPSPQSNGYHPAAKKPGQVTLQPQEVRGPLGSWAGCGTQHLHPHSLRPLSHTAIQRAETWLKDCHRSV